MIISFSAGFICGVLIITAVFIIVGNHSEIMYQVDRALKDKGVM